MFARSAFLMLALSLVVVSLACGSEAESTAVPATGAPTAVSVPAETPAPTDTPASAGMPTPEPTDAPTPTSTPLPTSTPTPAPTPKPKVELSAGTYAVGRELAPGLYAGMAGGDILNSCYWARLKDVSGSLDDIIANDNATGQFYIEVLDSDGYLDVGCEITPIAAWPAPSAPLDSMEPGTYLVGRDISVGTYQGQAGEGVLDSCYWERLSGLTGEFQDIIANDNATGQFYVKVLSTDQALTTSCALITAE